MADSADNTVEGLYGFPDAAQTHLELLMNRYVAALSAALAADEAGEPINLSAANGLRDSLLRSLELAAVATQMDGQAADDLIDAWMRLHVPR